MKLCKHVTYDWDDAVYVTKGIAVPIFGWSREEQGDVPLLKCSQCDATTQLADITVKVNRSAWTDRSATKPEPEGEPHFPERGYDADEVYVFDDEDDEEIAWS